MNITELGKVLIGCGVVLAVVGIIVWLIGLSGLAHLPGDFAFRKGRFTVFVPIATSILLSLLLTLILNVFARLLR